MKLIDADKLIEKLSAGLDNPEDLPVISIGTVMRMIDGEEEIHTSQPEIIYCGECIYYDPPHVENNGMRYEYAEMPKEAFDVLGTGLVSVEYGINVGGRCCVDYYCKNYPDDKRVYVPKDNYCGRAERRTDENN